MTHNSSIMTDFDSPWNLSTESLLANLSDLPDTFTIGDADVGLKIEEQDFVESEEELERLERQYSLRSVTGYGDDTESYSLDDSSVMQMSAKENFAPHYLAMHNSAEDEGLYGFAVSLGSQPKKVANPDWIFSEEQSKLYIKSMTPCPVRFSTRVLFKEGYIRATPIFKQTEYSKEVVRCCPNHIVQQTNKGNPTSAHFIRCSDIEEAQYEECPQSGRLSVRIPFVPSSGSSSEYSVHQCFCFVCNNSCGGLNRRQLQVVFTLETRDGDILGCSVIDVRVCACPGRDSKVDTESTTRMSKRGKRRLAAEVIKDISSETIPPACPTLASGSSASLSSKRRKAGQKDDNCTYTLKVCGFYNFAILKRIATALELFSNVENKVSSLGSQEQQIQDADKANRVEEADSTILRACASPDFPIPATSMAHVHEMWSYNPPAASHPMENTPTYQCYSMWRVTVAIADTRDSLD